MFQIPGTHLVQHQATLAGVPWLSVDTPGVQDEEVNDLEISLSTLDIDGIVSGAIRSDYQKSRLERMSERLGIRSWTPLWHQDSLEHMRGLVNHGFEIMLSSVSCEGLDASWIGRVLDEEHLSELEALSIQFRFNVDGEGGEYETLVIGGPHLPGRLNVTGAVRWEGSRGMFEFDEVTLESSQ